MQNVKSLSYRKEECCAKYRQEYRQANAHDKGGKEEVFKKMKDCIAKVDRSKIQHDENL